MRPARRTELAIRAVYVDEGLGEAALPAVSRVGSMLMSILCAGVGDGHGQGGGDAAHTTLRDKAPGTEVSKATIAGALIGFSISLVSAIVLVVQMVWRLSSWAMVLRRLLGYP
jgi:hypothetical protein